MPTKKPAVKEIKKTPKPTATVSKKGEIKTGCPWCGKLGPEKFVIEGMNQIYWVICMDCFGTGPSGNSHKEAVRLYNKLTTKKEQNKPKTNIKKTKLTKQGVKNERRKSNI